MDQSFLCEVNFTLAYISERANSQTDITLGDLQVLKRVCACACAHVCVDVKTGIRAQMLLHLYLMMKDREETLSGLISPCILLYLLILSMWCHH